MGNSDLKLRTKEYALSNGLNGAKRLNVLNDLNGIHPGARFCGREQLEPLTNEADQLMAIFVTIVRKTKA